MKQFMMTRAGLDAYTLVLLLTFFVIRTVVRITGFLPLSIPAYIILGYAIYRFFSSNRDRRQVENARVIALFGAVVRWFQFRRSVRADKDHRYFKCPNCQQPLRVPRGKGKIQVTCRICGAQFEEKA